MGFEYGYSVARPGGAHHVGGAVRRLRERCPDVIDEFISVRAGQVAAALRCRPAPAPRLRGPGPRPLVGAHRAVHDDRRRRRVHRRPAVDPGELLPPAAAPFAREHPPPDGGLHTEVDAEAQGCGLAAGRLHVAARSCRSSATTSPIPAAVSQLALCSGRIDVGPDGEKRKRLGDDGARTAIARVEQLYPRPVDELQAEMAKYPNLERIRWVQDEPANMGPWPHMKLNLSPELGRPSRSSWCLANESAAPSVGQVKVHQEELRGFSTPPSPDGRDVLHRSRHRGACRADAATTRSPSTGWPTGCRSSSTSTPSSRSRSSGLRPGSPGSTTPTDSARCRRGDAAQGVKTTLPKMSPAMHARRTRLAPSRAAAPGR